MTTRLDQLLSANLVFDGGEVRIPEQLGTPRADQMQGTPAEQLTELAGRVCYDSLGKGRPSFGSDGSEGYHDHIRATNHGSVLEHFNFTIEATFANTVIGDNRKMLIAWHCMNRPGVVVLPVRYPTGMRITTNLRSVREWSQWTRSIYGNDSDQFNLDRMIAAQLQRHAHQVAPNIIAPAPENVAVWGELKESRIVEPIADQERWATLFLSGSRGFSHEQVRHGDFTAISQRSTRYVDESESSWVHHPLVEQYLGEASDSALIDSDQQALVRGMIHGACETGTVSSAQATYCETVEALQNYLTIKGADKLTARKQARGAARGYLGNALYTEMIFSASVAQWRWMLNQRCSDAADAEIRLIYNQVLVELANSSYADRFADLQLRPAKDGIGMVLSA